MLGEPQGGDVGCLDPAVDDAEGRVRVLCCDLSHRVGEQEADTDHQVVLVSLEAQQLGAVGTITVG